MEIRETFNALIIDDEPQVRSLVANILEADGWNVTEVQTAEEAFREMKEHGWSLIFCDVVLGGIDGYQVLRKCAELQSGARFVLMTGYGSAAGALDATSIGAHDYLVKPFTVDDILKIASNVRKELHLRKEKISPNQRESPKPNYHSDLPLIGKSPCFVECLKLVGRVAATNLPVLITGESGTGKEVVARAIHRRSQRAAAPFVTVNCGAIPNELIESELFGHAKGSFTGAERERVGLWEEAMGGTLFLDEITETSPLFQVKLLRALQQGEIRRIGSNRTVKVDVRVLAATNRNIEREVSEGRFRQDLMYRLNAVTIELPPLRERGDDISILAEHFVALLRPESSAVKFSPAATQKLRSYNWPGNIRELENAVLHAGSLSNGVIYPEHFPARISNFMDTERDLETDKNGVVVASGANGKWLSLSELEEQYVTRVLNSTDGNKQAAARILDIDRKTLTRIIKRNGPTTNNQAGNLSGRQLSKS